MAYLLSLAWQTLREHGTLTVEAGEGPEQRSVTRVIGTTISINFLNPKLSMFFLAFLPQFIPGDTRQSLPTMLSTSASASSWRSPTAEGRRM